MRALPATALLLALAGARPAAGWEAHALPTAAALAELPEVARAPDVPVETLEAFLRAERERLAPLLDEEERWARAHLPHVPPRPDAIRFDPAAPDLRAAFLDALRVSPRVSLVPFLQAIPGRGDAGRPLVPWSAVGALPRAPHPGRVAFLGLREGERVAPLDVVATGSDEPDHGLDLGLFADSGTPQGARLGFGEQPFGDPRLDFGSQAAFHMGFFHEQALLYRLAPRLRRTFPELRIHQAATLARFALATGHPYWAYRFLGWGLHYVGDLTQPYHATPAPGFSLWTISIESALEAVGIHGPRRRTVQLLSNRHLALEELAFGRLWRELASGRRDGPLVSALRDAAGDDRLGPWLEDDPRAVISRAAARKAAATDGALRRAFPRWTEDPSLRIGDELSTEELDPAQAAQADAILVELFRDLGAHTRRYAREVLRR